MNAIRRAGSLLVVAALAVAGLTLDQRAQPSSGASPAPAAAPYAVCTLGEAARRTTTLSGLGAPPGSLELRVFSAGDIVATGEMQIREAPSASMTLNEMTGLARAPVLISLPEPAISTETLLANPGAAAAACGAGAPSTVVLPGGTTAEGEAFSVLLANPFSGPATVNIGAASEVGTESEPSLSGVIVPTRSLVVVDLATLLPGRQVMSVTVTPIIGRVVAAGLQEGGGDAAALAGMQPGGDWFLPVAPVEGVTQTLVLVNPGTAEVPFQVDVYGDEGLVEAAYEDTIDPRSQATVALADVLEGPGGLRVVAASPVGVALRGSGDGVRTITPAVASLSPSWMLPGAGRLGGSTVLLLNPGELSVEAAVRSGDARTELESVTVPANGMVSVPITERHGARVEADGDLAVSWFTVTEEGVASDVGQSVP